MTSCSVSNGRNRGVYIEHIYGHGHNSSVKASNFTQTNRPLYIFSQKVDIAFNRFYNNTCEPSINDCVTIQAVAYESLYFHGKRIKKLNRNFILQSFDQF
jgi:hypothetical protein